MQTYLIPATVIFVIITVITYLLLRRSLYRYILSLANTVSRLSHLGKSRTMLAPKIVNNLEKRFSEASENLETVNTMALIDQLYSQEKFKFFGLSLPCEQWDYFCRTLPNLLLSFGLLGTFIGITINLLNINFTLDQSSGDISQLIEQLQVPLQNMGLAFVSSLAAIACSSILIIINLRCNTNFAKTLLISSLEDYIDNVFKANIPGYSKLYYIVDNMVAQQEKFLTKMLGQQEKFLSNFLTKLQQDLEYSISKAANEIVISNQSFEDNVSTLVNKFNKVSNAISNSTDGFQKAVINLEGQITTVNKIIPQFEESSNKMKRSAEINWLASQKIEKSKFSENLEQLTSDLATTQKSFSKSTISLENNVIQFVEYSKESIDSAKQVYLQLEKTASTMQDSALGFIQAAGTFNKTDFADKLSSASRELISIPEKFNQSTEILHQSTENIAVAIKEINNSTKQVSNLVKKVNSLNQSSSKLLESTEANSKLQNSELATIIQKLHEHQLSVTKTQKQLVPISTMFQKQSESNTKQLQKLTESFNSGLSQNNSNSDRIFESFEQATINNNRDISNIVKELKQLIKQINIIPSKINESIDKLREQLVKDQESSPLNAEFAQAINQLSNIPLEIGKLIDSVEDSKIEVEINENSSFSNFLNNIKKPF